MVPDSGESRDAGAFEYPYSLGEEGEPTHSIVEAVAEIKGRDVTELDPLFAEIETEAMGDLLQSLESGDFYRSSESTQSMEGKVVFDYEGLEIEVLPRKIRIRRRTPQ